MNFIKTILSKILSFQNSNVPNTSLERNITTQNMLKAKMLIKDLLKKDTIHSLEEAEFKVFSQWGDDGIIQFLINHIDIENKTFIEFGVENYLESNTRFLLMNDNWKGLVIDGSKDNINYIKKDEIYWRYDLTAVCEFITKDNINDIFKHNNFTGNIGLLSIDIDGNDYWVWENINVIDPDIVVVEYNSIFGDKQALTIPYDPGFNRTQAHYSNLYWGCSLKALNCIAEKKNYSFVGTNSNGNNGYFVKNNKIGNLKVKSVSEGYHESKFRESRNEKGKLTFLSGSSRLEAIKDMIIFDIENQQNIQINDIII